MKYQFKALDHVQLAAPQNCEVQAIKFYRDILGFKVIEKPEPLKKKGGVWFQYGAIHLHIGIEEPFFPAKKAHPAFEVINIELFKRHLRENHIEVIDDTNLPGATRFYLHDPFGNRIEFLEWNDSGNEEIT